MAYGPGFHPRTISSSKGAQAGFSTTLNRPFTAFAKASARLLGPAVLNRQRTPMTEWKVGQRFRMSCVPWEEKSEAVARWHRFALDDPDFELIDATRIWLEMWGGEKEQLRPFVIPP